VVDLDLDAYFARIGYTGGREPTRTTLDAIAHAHVCAIPFENLDVLLGRPISLEPQAIVDKLVHAGRGGYCFEHNGLLLEVLGALGYEVVPISARVRWQRPREFTPPRTHVFLRVELDGESWLADVGVGGMSPTCALRLQADLEQPTPHEPRRLVREDGLWFHQARLGHDWHDVCEFTLEAMPRIDREVANWFTSAHPQSHFGNRLLVARAGAQGQRFTLLDRDFTHRRAAEVPQVRRLASEPELHTLLGEVFGLRLPQGAALRCPWLDWAAA
jgi:N-hydroxyarylamine O-acetyltransferase